MHKKMVVLLLLTVMAASGCSKKGPDRTSEIANETQTIGSEEIQSKTTDADKESDQGGEESDKGDDNDNVTEDNKDNTSKTVPFGQSLDNLRGGSPWSNSCLKELVDENTKTSLKDDFYLYTNQDWICNTEIPQDTLMWSSYNEANEKIEKNMLSILEGERPIDHDGQLVWDLYHACLDWDTRNAIGIEPLQATVDEINGIQTLDELSYFICDPEKCMFVDTFFSCQNWENLYDTSKYIPAIQFDEYILQDAKEYDGFSEMGARIYMAEREKLTGILERIGIEDKKVKEMLDATLDVEGELISAGTEPDDYFIYTMDEMSDLTKDFPLERFLNSRGYGVKEFFLTEWDSMYCLGELYTEDHLEDLKSYLIIRYIRNIMPFLDQESRDLAKECYNAIYGVQEKTTDQHDAYLRTDLELAEAVGHIYIEKYADQEKKEHIEQLTKEIIEEYCVMLQEEEWMQEETRKQAIEKLKAIKFQIFSPDKWQDYSDLDLEGKNYLECIEAIREYEHNLDLKRNGAKLDKDEWSGGSLLEVNAYYYPPQNKVAILLGRTEDAVYNDTSEEELYATLGYAIGHEISHAFDPKGAGYDKNGNYNYWWTQEDWNIYCEKVMKLIDYYNAMTVWGQTNVDGSMIINEAVADQTSIKLLLRLAKQKEEFDYEKFFTTIAESSREILTYEIAQTAFATDPHALPNIRVNSCLQQFDEFYETYDIKEGDGMYLAPEDRVHIW